VGGNEKKKSPIKVRGQGPRRPPWRRRDVKRSFLFGTPGEKKNKAHCPTRRGLRGVHYLHASSTKGVLYPRRVLDITTQKGIIRGKDPSTPRE